MFSAREPYYNEVERVKLQTTCMVAHHRNFSEGEKVGVSGHCYCLSIVVCRVRKAQWVNGQGDHMTAGEECYVIESEGKFSLLLPNDHQLTEVK